jgi:ABC-type oligopeptide transport system ATPase subunit
MNIVDTKNLVKIYNHGTFKKNKTVAVNKVNLEIEQGAVFGLIGPNGSGKTTFINLITGFISPTSGSIKVFDSNSSNIEIKKDRIKDKRLIFHKSDNRDEMYDKFVNSKKPSIMVSPSMMSGVDLKDELSRFAIILKIPYPNISSNKIKGRQNSNRNWYSWKTVVDIIQTYGRTVRSHEDYADTFILDSSLSNIMKYNSKYLPRYFTDAIKTLK